LRFHAVSRCGPRAQRPKFGACACVRLGASPSGALFGRQQIRPHPSDARGL